MVHYVFTPWRDRRELLAVRRQFYPSGTPPASTAVLEDPAAATEAAAAVARVAVWMHRGPCPHMVESTALLAAALLSERQHPASGFSTAFSSTSSSSSSSSAARAAYAAAFSRFVTGLLDGHQDRAHKQSMHGLARAVGLPPAFVELRHQVTHEQLPSLRRLRAAAVRAMAWIWQYYWVHLGAEEGDERVEEEQDETRKDNGCDDHAGYAVVAACVAADDSAGLARLARDWGETRVLAALTALAADGKDTIHDGRFLRCIRMARQLVQGQGRATTTMVTVAGTNTATDLPAIDLDAAWSSLAEQREALYRMEAADVDLQDEPAEKDTAMADAAPAAPSVHGSSELEPEWPPPRPCWARYDGNWTPRPIGVVP